MPMVSVESLGVCGSRTVPWTRWLAQPSQRKAAGNVSQHGILSDSGPDQEAQAGFRCGGKNREVGATRGGLCHRARCG